MLYGNLNNEYSNYFAPYVAFTITYNCQLFILKFIEGIVLHHPTWQVIECNTDSINVMYPIDEEEEYLAYCKEWEILTKLDLEHDVIKEHWRLAINDYLQVLETPKGDKVKHKGFFIKTPQLGKGYPFHIIPIALENYFVRGVNPLKTIREHDNIMDFVSCQRVKKDMTVYHGEKKVQNINRYYITKDKTKGYLIKYNPKTKGYTKIIASNPVSILNDYTDLSTSKYPDVDYNFYFKEVMKIIHKIEPPQTALF